MAFLLNASLSGGFNSTFSRAQQTLQKMQGEIQAVNRVQGDISSYQKAQAAVEATRNKLSVLQQQYDNLKNATASNSAEEAMLANQMLSKQAQIDKTTGKLQEQTEKLDQMGSALRDAGVDTGHLTEESSRLEAELGNLKKEQEQVAEKADQFGSHSMQAFEAAQQALAAAGITEGLKDIAEAYMECINLAGDFEETMSAVEAIANADAEGMAQLSDMAKELGATTKFTAQQSGEAMSYMAMAGWDVQDMLNGMGGVLSLAAASGEDLAMVSDIVTDSLTAFGLSASDTGHFSDVLAAAAANANTNVSIMGETMKMSASVAGALGYSIEDVAVAMGLMANSGVKGSIAGTALRNTFNGLLSGVTLTGKAFGEYNFEAVRTDGTMKGFAATIDELRVYFQQMTEAERVANAQAIAGQRGYNGLLAILNASDAEYQKLTTSINECTGAAERMASVRMDNMKGQLTLLQSAWEALRVTIGENFTDAMGGAYSVLTDVVTGVNDFLKAHPALVKAITAFVGVLGAGVAALTAVVTVTKVLIPLMGLLTASIPGVNVVAGLAAIAAAVVGISTATDRGVESVKDLTTVTRGMDTAMQEAASTYDQANMQVEANAAVAESYVAKLEQIESATHHHVEGNTEYLTTLQMLSQTMPELADYIDLETGSIEGGTAALLAHIEAWKEDAKEQAYREYMNSLYEEYNAVAAEAAENSIKLSQAQQKHDSAEQELALVIERKNKLLSEGAKSTSNYREEYGALVQRENELRRELNESEEAIYNLNTAVDESGRKLAEAEGQIDAGREAISNMALGSSEAEQVINATFEQLQTLADAYDATYKAALESFQGQFGLFDQAKADTDATVANAQAALDSQLTYWQTYSANIDVLRGQSADSLHLTQENYNALMSYVQSGSEEAAGLAASMVQAINSGNTQAVTDLGNTIGEVQKAQEQAASATAEWTTGLSEQTAQLVQDMTSKIAELDVSDEARSAAESTIQSYISQASGMTSAVQAAYASVAQAAMAGLRSGALSGVGGGAANGSGGGGGHFTAAVGTENAHRGYYLVGEEGPEIVWMDGGEQVMTAQETRRVQESMEANQKAEALMTPQIRRAQEEQAAVTLALPEASSDDGTALRGQTLALLTALQNQMDQMARERPASTAGTAPAPIVLPEMPHIDWVEDGTQIRKAYGAMDARESLPRETLQSITMNPELSAALRVQMPNAVQPARAVEAKSESPGATQIIVNVEFRFEGNVTREAVDDLREYGDEFKDRVREAVDEALADHDRRVYR